MEQNTWLFFLFFFLFFIHLNHPKHTYNLDCRMPSMSLFQLFHGTFDRSKGKQFSFVLVCLKNLISKICTLETISYALFSDPTSRKITPWMTMSFLFSCSYNTPICSQLQLSPSWSWCSRLLPCSITTTRQCCWLQQSNPKSPRTVQMTGCTGTLFQLGTE